MAQETQLHRTLQRHRSAMKTDAHMLTQMLTHSSALQHEMTLLE